MTAACLLLMSSVVAQYFPMGGYGTGYGPGYGYANTNGYGYGAPFYRTPLELYDPVRYSRYYSGEGYYTYNPPVIANPEVINLRQPTQTQSRPSITGVVLAVDEPHKQIKLQLPTSVAMVPYGPNTHFLAADGDFPVIKPGNLVKVEENTITIVRRTQK